MNNKTKTVLRRQLFSLNNKGLKVAYYKKYKDEKLSSPCKMRFGCELTTQKPPATYLAYLNMNPTHPFDDFT